MSIGTFEASWSPGRIELVRVNPIFLTCYKLQNIKWLCMVWRSCFMRWYNLGRETHGGFNCWIMLDYYGSTLVQSGSVITQSILTCYNMVGRVLFVKRALYTVHCTIHCTLERRRLWSPVLVNIINHYFVTYAAMKYATFYWNNFIWLPLI